MGKCLTTCLFSGLMLAATVAIAAEPVTLYVTPQGNNAWSGALASPNPAGDDGPLATPSAARDRLRSLRQTAGGALGPVQVILRGGDYFLAEPLEFGPEDSGTCDAPVSFEGYPGETPILHGGKRIANWQVVNGLWVADLPEVREGRWTFGALWVNGERRTPARTPNAVSPAGDFPTDAELFFMDGPVMTKGADGKETPSNEAICFREGDIKDWAGLDDAVFVTYHSWETSQLRMKALDTAARTVTFTGGAPWPFGYWRKDQWYFVENLMEGLDQPGEWCLRRKEGRVYYLPKPGETPETAEVYAPVTRQLVRFKGRPEEDAFVQYVQFRGIHFAYTEESIEPEGHADSQAEASVPGAIEWIGARHCLLEDCALKHLGNYGMWFRRGCQDNLMRRCEVADLGAGGVRIGETGDPATPGEAVLRNIVDNCFLHDGGRIFRGAIGVWIGRSSYNQVSHNEICDFRYTGVSIGWSWGYDPSSANHNLIEYNHIHHLGLGQLSDMGGIYTLGVSPGTILRNNYIHNIHSNPKVSGGWGLYTDEGSTDILLENNVVYHTTTGGFHQHYGRENRVTNNIFAYSHTDQLVRSRNEEHISFFFTRNIVLYNNGRLLGGNWQKDRYYVEDNVYWDATGLAPDFFGNDFVEWQADGRDSRSVVANPLFADIEPGDFSLKPDSPALALGFRPIDIRLSGLYGDPDWVAAPKRISRPSRPLPEPEEPTRISLDFESQKTGELCPQAQTAGEEGDATIRVTDTVAAHGKHSLHFADAPDLNQTYNPHLIFSPGLRGGLAVARFSLRLSPGAWFYHEWRDSRTPYRVGPSIHFLTDGNIRVGGKTIPAQWKPDTWMEVAIACPLGDQANGQYDISLTIPEQAPIQLLKSACGNPDFKRIDWFGFVANSNAKTDMFLDNLELAIEQEKMP